MAKPSVTRRLQQRTQTTMLRQVTATILPPASDFFGSITQGPPCGSHFRIIHQIEKFTFDQQMFNTIIALRFQGAGGAGGAGAGGSSSARPSEVRLLTEIQDKFRRFVDENWRFVDENWRF